jgi:precorrin-6B methylase 2
MVRSNNNTDLRPVSAIKNLIVPSGSRPRTIPFGPFRGLILNIDLRSQSQFYFGLWELETYPYIRAALKEATWIIDVGAGFGELCILFRKNFCHAVAIEPDAASLSALHSNLALNGLTDSDVEIVSRYVGTKSDQDHVRLDDIQVDRFGTGFIKIDIEGLEADALDSAVSLLNEVNLKLLIETHSRESESRCMAFLEQHQYYSKIINNSRWRWIIPERRPLPHNRWIWAERRFPTGARQTTRRIPST